MLQCWSLLGYILQFRVCHHEIGRLHTEGSRWGSQMLMVPTASWKNLPHSLVPICNLNPFPSVTDHLVFSLFPCWIPISLCFHFAFSTLFTTFCQIYSFLLYPMKYRNLQLWGPPKIWQSLNWARIEILVPPKISAVDLEVIDLMMVVERILASNKELNQLKNEGRALEGLKNNIWQKNHVE